MGSDLKSVEILVGFHRYINGLRRKYWPDEPVGVALELHQPLPDGPLSILHLLYSTSYKLLFLIQPPPWLNPAPTG